MEASLKELQRILEWLEKEGFDDTVLIGGWAVQAYNMWYGSIDIDLVMTGDARDRLHSHLRSRGYSEGGLFDDEGFGLNHTAGRIVIETFSRDNPQPFESRRDHRLDFDVLEDPKRTREREIEDVLARVPSREVLLAFKLKAAWDRSRRLEEDRSPDPDYEESKVIKDNADALALLDPSAGGQEIDLTWMSQLYTDHPFLVETTRGIHQDQDALDDYGVSQTEGQRWVDTLLDLATE